MAKGSFDVLIESGWCKACGICAAFCPTDTLSVEPGNPAQVRNADTCTGCGLCERLCPDLAIEVRKREPTGIPA